jgi:hypothetical protein
MAESVLVVCDVCGNYPADTVRITAKDRNYDKDLCASHLSELLASARAPRRGRPRSTSRATASPATPVTTPKRRGRPPKAQGSNDQAANGPAGRRRGPITDPVLLQKRRDALAKARAARAAKRAAGS